MFDNISELTKYFPIVPRIYLDSETTGLEPGDGVILSLAMIYHQFSGNIPYEQEPKDYLELVIKPTEEQWAKASPEALKVNGMTWEFCQEHGVDFVEATQILTSWVLEHYRRNTDMFLIGQNPKFDIKFLNYFFGDSFRFFGLPFNNLLVVDTIETFKYVQKFDHNLRTDRYNGHAISRALGVEEETKVHTAMGGASVVYRNYWALYNRMETVMAKLREDALKGTSTKAMLLPNNYNYGDWTKNFKTLGWSSPMPNHYVDKDGQRWLMVNGAPPILVKI